MKKFLTLHLKIKVTKIKEFSTVSTEFSTIFCLRFQLFNIVINIDMLKVLILPV